MPERTSAIPAWAWIVGAVLVIVSIFAGYRMVQTQQHLAAAQSELESAKQAAEKANAERNELQTKLDEATSEVRSAQSRLAKTQPLLEAAQSALESAKQAVRRRTPSALKFRPNWTRPHRRPNQSNPSLRRRSLVWKQRKANLRAPSKWRNRQKRKSAELEQKAASLNSELQKADGQRIDLQAKLDEAGSEIERLKSELEKAPRAESP